MKVKVWQKDMEVIGDFAKALGVPDAAVFRHRAASTTRR